MTLNWYFRGMGQPRQNNAPLAQCKRVLKLWLMKLQYLQQKK